MSLGRLLRSAFAAQIFRHPDVYHAWCELVVQNRFVSLRSDVREFLVQHQSMGVATACQQEVMSPGAGRQTGCLPRALH